MIKIFFNFILAAGVILMTPVSVLAAKIIVADTLDAFSTQNPPKSVQIRLIKNTNFYDFELPKGTVINCEIIDVNPPKRLKRDATFSLEPKSYVIDEENAQEFEIVQKAKYVKSIEVKSAAKSLATDAALSVGNKLVPGLGIGVGVIEGALNSDDGSRIVGAVSGLYESTPLSYLGTGKNLSIGAGDRIIFKLSKMQTKE